MSGAAQGRTSIYRGAAMAVLLTWALRAIGLVSVFILARVLQPDDFGVVGLAMTAVAMVEIFSFLGLRQALLLLTGEQRDYYDTAFTIQLTVFGALALALVALADPVARFFAEPRVEPVIFALAFRFILLGVTNIGIVEFDRNRDFGRDLKMRAGARIVSFFVTVALALTLRNYWALVAGMLIQSALLTALSYSLQPYRPRLSLVRRAELLGVSLWIFAGVAAQAVYSQVERVVLGRVADTETVGAFAVSKDLSSILTQEIATALNRVTFVQTAESGALAEQGTRMAKALGAYALIVAPLGLGLAAVAEDFIAVVLGTKWIATAVLVPPIAAASALMAVYKLVASSLQAGGHERISALASMAGAVVLAVTAGGVAANGGGVLAIAQTGLLVTTALLIGGLMLLALKSRHPIGGFLASVGRPFLAGGVMLVVLQWLPRATEAPFLELAWRVILGAGIYCAMLLLLWVAGGRRDTAEGTLITLVGGVLDRRKSSEAA